MLAAIKISGSPDCEGLLSSYVLGALFYILSTFLSTDLKVIDYLSAS